MKTAHLSDSNQSGVKKFILAKDRALDLLYPRRCASCGEILDASALLVCKECAADLRPITGPICMKCGTPVREEEEYCRNCRKIRHLFDQGRGIFAYNDRWKLSIERYKYYGYREFAGFYAAAMVRWGQSEIRRWKPDLIVPVPLHIRKERVRGFNQSWEIARLVGERTGIPAARHVLHKTKKTASQKKLDYVKRRNNLRGSFTAGPEVRGKRVLVIDDVYTTGSTMDEAAAALYGAGCAGVNFLTFCLTVQ